MKKRILALILALALCLSLGLSAIAAGGFDDVSDSAWYLKYLDTAVGSGLINGRGDGVFAPDDSITGAEAVKLSACLGQLLSDGEVTLQNGSPWYVTYMDYAVEHGIIDAALDEYAANAPIMRSDLMDMVCRAIPEVLRTEINSIPDGSIPDVFASAYYSDSVYTLYRMGIVTGADERGSCLPDEYIRRSEVAALVARVVDEDLRVSFSLAEPASELSELRTRAENDGALCAAALLGYASTYDEAAATKLYPFLSDVPAENRTVVNGDELYFIVPCEGVTAKVYEYAFDWEGSGGYKRGELLADYGSEPFTLRCNVSDIVSNTLIVLESDDGSVLEYSPYVSLKDGTLGVPDSGVYDFTQY
jgi:hypothetical protein